MTIHQGIPVLNLNLALVASKVWPHLAVIDGWQGMEQDTNGSSPFDPLMSRIVPIRRNPCSCKVRLWAAIGSSE
jgi:hypothetical protein